MNSFKIRPRPDERVKMVSLPLRKKSAAAAKLRNAAFKSPLDEINVFNWDCAFAF